MNARTLVYRTLWAALMAAGLLALIPMLGYLSGCNTPVPGLRLAPEEEQKQAAQVVRDTASGGALVGIPPGSDAAKMLRQSAAPAASYMGPPRNPVDVTAALVTAGEQWKVMEAKLAALAIRERIGQETAAACKTALAQLVARIAEAKKTVRPMDILPIAQAIARMEEIGRKVQSSVVVPDSQLTDAERESSGRLAAAVESITTVADMLASRQATLGDVGDKAADAITNAADKAAGWIDQVTSNPTIASLVTALGLGGVGGGLVLRSRSRKRAEEDAAYDAELAAAKAKAETLASSGTGKSDALVAALLSVLGATRPAMPQPAAATEPETTATTTVAPQA
ncbi:MAG: hypothetical protein BWX88_05126 [Planctomycetes bacterium ADurb.Bin126]|nr:MAG: hypothetical protein BWX88_05126 [Planctomycetes bacterium ADurb.Bin126]HOD84908.1 hypothetical protein [Phycisphaerae bacterium]